MRPQMYLPTGPLWNGVLSYANSFGRLRYLPRIGAPRTFNEHFLAQKMACDTDLSLARTVTDKVEFKEWLAARGFPELVIRNVLVAEKSRELAGVVLPKSCIVKPSHSSGHLLLVREEKDRELTGEELARLDGWLGEDYYRRGREPNYRGLKPRLIVEELLIDEKGEPPADYKIFCVKGKPFMIQLDLGRFTRHTRQLYTPGWELLPYSMCYPRHPQPQPRPKALERALWIAGELARDIFLCRVDLYLLGESEIRAGEITFFPGNCAERFTPESGDLEIGKLISRLIACSEEK